MSIKSQKSLYEECSEIVERSYSVRSYSDESYSCDDEDECLARELMNKLTPAMLSKLRRCFRKSKQKKRGADIDRRVEEVMREAAAEEGIEFAVTPPGDDDPLCLDEDSFVSALDGIFGHHKYTTHAHKLYQLLDPFSTGRVGWRQLLDKLVAEGARRTATRADVWAPATEARVERLEHCKRETIVKLVSFERIDSFCYVAVTKGGRVGVYSGHLQLIHSYEVSFERIDSFCYVAVTKGGRVGVYSGHLQLIHSYEVFLHRTGTSRRVRNCWITDAVYLCDVQCLIFSASDRSVTVYDVVTLTHTPVYCISGLPNIPTCMAYTPTSSSGCSELALGTERGDITRVRFLQPRVSLFHTRSNEQINYYFWMELSAPPHTAYCSLHTWKRAHSRSVRRLAYERDGQIIVSCSHDSEVSIRLRNVPGKLDDYLFKVQRGVTCFHVVPSLHLLATGSCDGVVRLWETTQSNPFATLTAPGQAAVLDVAVIAAKEIVIGYCSNCWLHIWDIYEECLLQTIKVKFPFLGVLGKKAEFGAFCIHPGPARKKTTEDDQEVEDDEDLLSQGLEAMTSRRPSSVYQGSTGGLILQTDDGERTTRTLEEDKEYIRFNRPEILVTCCDHVSTIQFNRSSSNKKGSRDKHKLPDTSSEEILPPPGDTLRPRRPSFWDLPDDVLKDLPISPQAPTPSVSSGLDPSYTASVRSDIPSSMLLSPSMAEYPPQDLETLLENAGLQGILEKDFVLMRGLKHDLNRKLADMKANINTMTSAVSMGAPYLALRCSEPTPIPAVNDMMDEYRRVMKMFPESSVAGTPTGSSISTPRKKNSLPPL